METQISMRPSTVFAGCTAQLISVEGCSHEDIQQVPIFLLDARNSAVQSGFLAETWRLPTGPYA
jgi:hypothetical protein